MAIRRIGGSVLGVEAHGVDLLTASDEAVDAVVSAMHGAGRGLLVVRNQSLSPEGYERALFRLGHASGGFGTPLQYDRWPGQSPRLRCCKYVSLLGNYRATVADELGTGAAVGDRIGEYKPAREELREWHTDGSFLPRPKIGIALYSPSRAPVESCAPCAEGHRRAWWHTLLRLPCRPGEEGRCTRYSLVMWFREDDAQCRAGGDVDAATRMYRRSADAGLAEGRYAWASMAVQMNFAGACEQHPKAAR